MEQYEVLLYYKYVHIDDPEKLMQEQRLLCQRLDLKGRILIAAEGLNGTVEGTKENTTKYCEELTKDPRFSDIQFKKSVGTGSAFPKLSVKVREEIVTGYLGQDDIDPTKITGQYLQPEELHEWIKTGKEFYIVDMRNDYEQKSGYFEGSILSGFENFRDLPAILPKLKHLKNKTIVTVCTGGVRCEKASGFLVKNGFLSVYQLYGGIVSYMEKYPNQDFKGKLYVFDNRVVMGFNIDSPEHQIVGSCRLCGQPSDHYVNCANNSCHDHFICCENCYYNDGKSYCGKACFNSPLDNVI